MIQFSRHILDNGLTVICHTDKSTPFVSVNVLYKVGSQRAVSIFEAMNKRTKPVSPIYSNT